MKTSRTTLGIVSALTLTAFTTAACSPSEDTTAPAASAAPPTIDLLSHVPSDTPYVAANLEPIPNAIIDRYLERMQPAFDELQKEIERVQAELAAKAETSTGGEAENHGGDEQAAQVLLALINEFDGKLSREGMASLGLDINSNKVFYGNGIFPVMRMGLSDADTLRATISRVLSNAGLPNSPSELQGVPYWKIADEQEIPLGFYAAVLDDQLVLAMLPLAEEQQQLPLLLGLEKPADSNVRKRVTEFNSRYEYTPHGTGFVDVHKLADQFLLPGSSAAQLMAAQGEFDPSTLSEACHQEIRGMIDLAPEMVFGTREISNEAIAYQYRMIMPDTLASRLTQLVARVPVAQEVSDYLLEISFGIKVGAARDFVLEKATAIVNEPYQCEHFDQFNQQALQLVSQLNQPILPFINNFRGLRAQLDQVDWDAESIPTDGRGHMALHIEQPQMVVGMAQMFLPDLSQLNLLPGEPPVQIPENVIPAPGIVAYAAMNDSSIGVSVGDGEQESLPAFLDQPEGPEGVFLSFGYDMEAYLKHSSAFSEAAIAGAYQDELDEEGQARHEAMQHQQRVAEAFSQAIADMVDRNYSTLSFEVGGFVVEGRTTLKP